MQQRHQVSKRVETILTSIRGSTINDVRVPKEQQWGDEYSAVHLVGASDVQVLFFVDPVQIIDEGAAEVFAITATDHPVLAEYQQWPGGPPIEWQSLTACRSVFSQRITSTELLQRLETVVHDATGQVLVRVAIDHGVVIRFDGGVNLIIRTANSMPLTMTVTCVTRVEIEAGEVQRIVT